MPLPLSAKDIDINSYQCGLVDGDPMASFRLKSGEQLDYRHGQVIAFYSSDAMHLPGRASPTTYPEIDRERAKFFGPVNMTSDEAVNLIRQTARRLGYSEHTLHLDETPRVSGPTWWGTNRIARCFVEWRESIDGPTYVNAEVDVGKKVLKSFYVNDHAITNIWRQPPNVISSCPTDQFFGGLESLSMPSVQPFLFCCSSLWFINPLSLILVHST